MMQVIKNYEYYGDENEFSYIDPDEFFDGRVTLYYDLNNKVRYMVIDYIEKSKTNKNKKFGKYKGGLIKTSLIPGGSQYNVSS